MRGRLVVFAMVSEKKAEEECQHPDDDEGGQATTEASASMAVMMAMAMTQEGHCGGGTDGTAKKTDHGVLLSAVPESLEPLTLCRLSACHAHIVCQTMVWKQGRRCGIGSVISFLRENYGLSKAGKTV